MSATVVIRCDGTPTERPTMSLERCRAYLPTPAFTPDEARHLHGYPTGWTRVDRRDLCPACGSSAGTR